jgi:hypothetical protein
MKTVLSIDGGGIRGLIPALVLAEIETRTGKSVADCFDLIAGTSTGGILALGFARGDGSGRPGYTAKDLAGIYQTRGKEIFSRSLWKGATSLGGLADELYSHKGLDAVLEEYFGNEPLGAALTHTLISSYDIQNRQPVFFTRFLCPVPGNRGVGPAHRFCRSQGLGQGRLAGTAAQLHV